MNSRVLVFIMALFNACQLTERQAAEFVPFTRSVDWEKDFANPPADARARVFWWWLEGYITRQGIMDDLHAMKEAGIAGAIVFDAGSSGYYTGGKPTYHNSVLPTQQGVGFMTPEWRDLFAFSCRVADSLGIELSLSITSGWNDGGPWVTPEYASQKLVWSEITVAGGQVIDSLLPLPEKLLTFKGYPYFSPIAVLALKLSPEAGTVEPLPWFDIKAVHSIAIPQTPTGLGYDWEALVRPLPDGLTGCHALEDDVTDISEYVDGDGRLKWEAPPGRYAILRFGHTGTGVSVSTHSPGAGGLAIDYMSAEATNLQFEHVVAPILQDLRKTGCQSLRYLHDDSWELGAANWTPSMEKTFAAATGYDIRKYLPVIAGKIIESHDVSDRFLYDFRRTIADLVHQNHYRRLKELAHRHGMGLHPESGGPHPAPIDALKNMGENDIPMGEFWTIANTHRVEPHRRLYVKQGASAAHIYGKRFMQAEGPTSIGPHWERDPWMLKPTMDRVFCEGMNRFVIHTFTHSPREAGLPGNEYFAGTHFNPNVTWWKQGKAFLDWSARNSFMLSQGLFVADVAFYYGDNVPNQVPLKNIDPRLGEGYDYDVVNTDVILNRMAARNGKIYLPDGMSYHVLVLPDRKAILPETLEKIERLVKEGGVVVGPKPETGTGLKNIRTSGTKIARIAGRLWGNIDGVDVTENRYGKGKVVWGKEIRTVLQDKGVTPDFEYAGGREQSALSVDYIHRCDSGRHIYYVANRKEQQELLICRFRVGDMQPELWYPETGKTVPVPVYSCEGGQTSLPLSLDPYGSVFVVFRSPAENPPVASLSPGDTTLFPDIASTLETHLIDGDWHVSFDTTWRAPAHTTFAQLISWTEHPNPDIKYYSGTAVYRKTIDIAPAMITNRRIRLDLGKVHNIAEVRINGHPVGIWWKKPFAGDITEWLQEGKNTLEVTIVNLWPNRL
ncbi:MAG: glycoside hydrolase family 2, partial [Tannerellaceae bacterium]|nr:glycoside hydrolase family 2 [Tannerellaceae bacterium]